jgi:kynurenine 3-monooxygenase
VSSLVTIRCFPWNKSRTLLLGDAAHAIVPFFGQGMNAGFEDVDLLMHALPKHQTWESLFEAFAYARKPDTDAIADLALANFIEMRDKVTDADFNFQRKISSRLYALLPTEWVPLYTLVSFTSTPYSKALAEGKEQERILKRIAKKDNAHENFLDEAWLLESYYWAQNFVEV